MNSQTVDEFEKEIGFGIENQIEIGQEKLDLIKKLAHIHCSNKEIAMVAKIHIDTLIKNYSDILDEARMAGKSSLKRRMWKAAMDEGSVPMMMFLAKNLLGYFDDPLKKEEALKRSVTRLSDDELEKKVQHVIELRKNANGSHE